MKENSIDRLMTLNFWRICAANMLLFAAVYMFLPLLPDAMAERIGGTWNECGSLYLLFALGMLIVGPFHAYLGDTYRRKGVLQLSLLGLLLSTAGYLFAHDIYQWYLLSCVQGACMGLAVTAGITVAIDITTSVRRSAGNRVYAWAARLGMLAGVLLAFESHCRLDFRTMVYVSAICLVVGLFFASRVHIAFRAPIGLPLCSIDRFLLPRAWLPFIAAFSTGTVSGILMPLLSHGRCEAVGFVVVLLFLIVPFTTLFVRLSHHCQRGTANTSCHLALDLGNLAGMWLTCRFYLDGQSVLDGGRSVSMALLAGFISLLLWIPAYLYYKKKRVR